MVSFCCLFFPRLINYSHIFTFQKTLRWVIVGNIIVIAGLVFIPNLVFAGLFSSPAHAGNARVESIQTLPILQARLSPMMLTSVGGPDPITDEDSLTNQNGLYDLDNIDVPSNDQISTYVVQSGDSISEIADRYDVSINTIRWANNIPKNQGVKVGQKLVILPITGLRHKVAKGDTIASIAKKYKADVKDIESYNNLDSNEDLIAGTMIIIPDGELAITQTQIATIKAKSGGKSTDAQYKSALVKISKNNTTDVNDGYYARPVQTNGGNIRKTQGYHGPYNGVDIGAPIGTPIYAMADGVVILARVSGYNGGYGGITIIQHDNGTQTVYAHQSAINVEAGQQVNKGQMIGKVGNTGRSSGPHLHFEIRGVSKTPVLY